MDRLFRIIVVVAGERTVQMTVSLEQVPRPGESIVLEDGPVTVRHVIEARRGGVAGIVLAWAG